MNNSFSDLLATFLACTDQKEKTANSITELALPLFSGRDVFVDISNDPGMGGMTKPGAAGKPV